jgi:catechol 2,3-dioxygenase
MTTATEDFDLKAAPMRIGRVRLKVRDLPRVSEFYQRVLGLSGIAGDGARVTLGTADAPFLDLVGDPSLAPRDPRDAGLFHTAFLLPSRADLARWLRFAIESKVVLDGASDHIVSEAIYLSDPEGNGIEVYADRPPARWQSADGRIRMTTEPLDGRGLMAADGGRVWAGLPEGGFVGHVHLQVGDTATADRFYAGVLGFDIAARYPGASFYGSGGYHHQLAGNVWNSRRAGARPAQAAGLDAVEIVVRDQVERDRMLERAAGAGFAPDTGDGAPRLRDPWGTELTLVT